MAHAYYDSPLARIHHEGFGFHAGAVAPGVLRALQPVLARGGTVLELGCGSGLLTRHLVDAGHTVIATDASQTMLEIARNHAPGAEFRMLTLPDDPLPAADAIVAVGHPLNYLPTRDAIHRALAVMCAALTPGGILAFDICDLSYGRSRTGEQPRSWVREDWVLVTATEVPSPDRFIRRMTMFTRTADAAWTRTDEQHDNVLLDTAGLPALLAGHGVAATLSAAFGEEENPSGLVCVVGHKRATALP